VTYKDRDRVIAWLDAGHGEKLSTIARIALVTIAENANGKTGLAWPGHELMITRWGMSAKSVKRANAKLSDLGLLEIAQRGAWGRRSRYRLAGDLLPDTSVDVDTEIHGGSVEVHGGSPSKPSRGHTDPISGVTQTPYYGVTQTPVYRSLLRSSNGEEEDDDDGATHRAPLGSPGAAPAVAVHKQISETLNYTDDRTATWIETKLAGRQPRNIDAYLLRCLDNQVADAAKATATRGAAKKTPKPESAKAGGKQSKKTSGKTGGKTICPRCGRDFPTTRSLASHNSHCATVQCPICNTTVKARDLSDHHERIHRAAFVRSIQDQSPCIHGVPGGNIPEPNGTSTIWRHCDRCRVDGIRKRYAGQSSTPHPAAPAKNSQPPKPKRDPKPCQGCNRPLTGWAAVQTPSYCANCRASRAATSHERTAS
jgi:hypothetical protein